jgi:hypothetical protein
MSVEKLRRLITDEELFKKSLIMLDSFLDIDLTEASIAG